MSISFLFFLIFVSLKSSVGYCSTYVLFRRFFHGKDWPTYSLDKALNSVVKITSKKTSWANYLQVWKRSASGIEILAIEGKIFLGWYYLNYWISSLLNMICFSLWGNGWWNRIPEPLLLVFLLSFPYKFVVIYGLGISTWFH